MIRINLLKSLQALPEVERIEEPARDAVSEFVAEPRGNGHLLLWVLVPIVLLASAGTGIYLAMRRSHTETPVEKIEPIEPAPVADTAHAWVPVASDLSPNALVPDSVKPATDSAAEPDPSRRIAFQYFTGTRLFQDLQNAAPQSVGFTRIMFTPPGEFYAHGVAGTDDDLQRFKRALTALPGALLTQDQSQPVGPGGMAREFHFSGNLRYDTSGMVSTENRVMAADQVGAALKGFMNTTHSLGIELEPIQLLDSSVSGGLTRLLYHTEAGCDYARLQALLEKLQRTRSHVGFQRVSLEAQGNEKMTASLDLLVYAR